MQCSFVKIQDLIGYVRLLVNICQCDPKRPIKQLKYADYLLSMDENQISACLCKFHSRAGIIGTQKASNLARV
jgi:hypothetical protein